MPKKITKLSEQQESRLIEFREEWRRIGLCCDPADFVAGDGVITGFYKRLGKAAPIILHFSSPAMCELAANFVFAILQDSQLHSQLRSQQDSQLDSQLHSQLDSQLHSQLYSQLHSQLYSQLRSQLYSQLHSQLRSQLDSQLRSQLDSQLDSQLRSQLDSQLDSQLHSQLYSQLRSQLYSQLHSQLRSQLDSQLDSQLRSQLDSQLDSQLHSQLDSQLDSQLYSQLRSQLDSQLRSQLDSQLYSQLHSQLRSQLRSLRPFFLNNRWGSQHWCTWEAFYLFGHEIGVEYRAEDIALLQEWARLSNSIGWWAPWDGICFVSDRPRFVNFDDQRRLHNETRAAVEYSDGWGVHAWHGVRVPKEWIEDKESLTAKAALTWENIEQRRAACELVGWDKILSELKAKTIDKDEDEQIGELVEVTLPDAGKERFLRVLCGTSRRFAIPVPKEMKTAIQAQAWTYGFDDWKQFIRPEVRT